MKKERTKAKKYANKGITLIALVITIVLNSWCCGQNKKTLASKTQIERKK